MSGAINLDHHIKRKNIDKYRFREEEGTFLVSCSGGVRGKCGMYQ